MVIQKRDRGIKRYQKIVSLDFELYNTMFYWSICWVGVCVVSDTFEPLAAPFDIRVNPVIRHKFTGKDLKFPFTGAEIRQEKVFGEVAGQLLQYLDSDTLVIGHAFDNDAKMLIDACYRYHIPCPSFDYIDTNTLYNAHSGESGERSLTKLAEKYGIEFTAHDPLEDARATLEVAKVLIKDNLYGFLTEYGIEPSKLCGGVLYRGSAGKTVSEEKKKKNALYNLAFLKSGKVSSPVRRYFFEPSLLSEQDLSAVLDALTALECGFASTAFSADVVVTNNLILSGDPKVKLLRALVRELGLSAHNFDFSPKKVRGVNNKPITQDEYYACAYAHLAKSGVLQGAAVAFSKGAEHSEHFERMIERIVQNGGRVTFLIPEADYFLVCNRQEIKEKSDGRVRAYRRCRKAKFLSIDEFFMMLENQR